MDTHDACHESRRRDGVNPAGLSRRVFDFKQLLMDIPRLRQAMRTQRISVAKLGGLPIGSVPSSPSSETLFCGILPNRAYWPTWRSSYEVVWHPGVHAGEAYVA